MQGVLILAHGSRVESTKQTIEAVAARVRENLGGVPLCVAYMEFCPENIEKGVDALAAAGVDEICAAPYFLFDGIHIREDIPALLAAALEKHPGVRVHMAATLGADPRLADILTDRIRAAQEKAE